MVYLKIICILFYWKIVFVQSANILGVFPTPSISHQIVFRKLTLELAKTGHHMTIITTDPVYSKGKSPENYKEIDVGHVSYPIFEEKFHNAFKVGESVSKFTEGRYRSLMQIEMLETQIKTPEVQELLAKDANTFDLILIEAFMYLALAFSHKFKAPVILVSSLGPVYHINDIVGMPSHPFLYPAVTDERIYNLSILEKVNTLKTLFSYKYASYLSEDNENAQLKKYFGPEIPPISELYNNVDMLFLNVNPMWIDNQPVPPNVIYMMKLFITQAGLQSTDEAITAEVPLLAISILGDQRFNAEKYVKYGIGTKLDIETFTANEFKNAIETVINTEVYKNNVKKLKRLFLDQPEPPLQRAVWWSEYIIRNKGAKHLRCPTANISYVEYLELKFIFIIFFTLVIICITCVKVIAYLYTLLIKVFRRYKLKMT